MKRDEAFRVSSKVCKAVEKDQEEGSERSGQIERGGGRAFDDEP